MAITQVITAIPAAGHRGVDVKTTFVTKQEAFQDALTDTTVTELNNFVTQANTLQADVNSKQATASAAATTATTQATNASASAASAATSAANAAAIYDAFDNRYLGSKATNPTLDNDGGALLIGATYWNTTSLDYRVYNGTAWTAPATLASASATSAAASATTATTQATSAAASATTATTQATTATTQATNAATQATTATTQATNAATSAATATTQATNAAASATTATTQAGLANTARVAAEAALDAFDDRYLGSKASTPTVDNDGNALVSGALYFNDTLNAMYVYDLGTTTWISLGFNPTDHTALTNIGTRTHAQLESDIASKEPIITILPIARGGTGTTTNTGTGNNVLSTSPTLITPALGVATGTSFNAITALASATSPMDGTATIGTSTAVARQDHVHPSDTSKQATITGAATSITGSNLTASMAIVSDASGKVAAHGTVTSTELGYLDGVTSDIQTQITAAATAASNAQTTANGKIAATNYASADGTIGGTIKARINGSTLYLTTNGVNA